MTTATNMQTTHQAAETLQDFVILIGGMPGPCYLTEPGDEDQPADLNTTRDPELASRFVTKGDARRAMAVAVDLHPRNEFTIGTVPLAAG